jgi:hypothetical protein
VTSVVAATVVAYAVGNGDIKASPEVQVITITGTTTGASATTQLQNTTSATTYNVLVADDASCDPTLMFAVSGGNPVAISPSTMRAVTLTCPPRGVPAMRRCVYHATNNANGAALADFMNVCIYGASPGTLTPQQTALDFGTVTVGDSTMLPVAIANAGASAITRVYLQTSDLAGNFQLGAPCNPDAPYCDQDVMAVGPGGTLTVQVKCTPQTTGTHTAQLYVATNTYQLLAQPVTLTCMGGPATAPVLAINPTGIDVPTPIEATDGSASTVIHLTNAGVGTVLINDVRTVDVDTGAASDWSYAASGECTGVISSQCSLDAGKQVDLNLTFDPSAIGRRRATLLISYRDTIDRTKEISLDGIGLGATLDALGNTTLAFGQVPVGRTSTLDFDLLNRGNRDITAMLSLSPNTSPPFTLTPASTALVTPNVPKPISATCAPSTPGSLMTTATAQAMDALTGSPVSINLSCEGITSQLYANPTALNLGEVRIGGTPVQRTIQLLSTGGTLTLTGQPQLEGASSGGITLAPLSQMTTPATFDITIDPLASSEGQLTATINVPDSDGDTLAIPVVGKIVRASYEVSPEVDLGTFCVGQPTTSSNVSLASDGTATIELTKPTLGGSPSAFELEATRPTAYPSLLAAGATATVSITPHRQMAVAQLADTLTWHTDVDDMPDATTAITARFIDQGGAIAPPALDFGKVKVHLFSEDGQRVVIQNCNPTPLVLDPPVIRTPFRIDSPNLPSMLNPNETTVFSVGFHPTQIGVVSDILRITSPQLPNAPLEVTLVGEGVTDEPTSPDAGVGAGAVDHTSFYACSCKSTRPAGGFPIVIAVMCVLLPRRRRRRNRLF